MKPREIILDFTSLLDIIMIILFWFIIQGQNTVQAEKNRAADAVQQAESAAAEYDKMLREVYDEWEAASRSDIMAAQNQKALYDFSNGRLLHFNMYYDGCWTLDVSMNKTFTDSIGLEDNENLAEKIKAVLKNNGFSENDVIIGLFSFDGEQSGSYRYANQVINSLKTVKQDLFSNLYVCNNNI